MNQTVNHAKCLNVQSFSQHLFATAFHMQGSRGGKICDKNAIPFYVNATQNWSCHYVNTNISFKTYQITNIHAPFSTFCRRLFYSCKLILFGNQIMFNIPYCCIYFPQPKSWRVSIFSFTHHFLATSEAQAMTIDCCTKVMWI